MFKRNQTSQWLVAAAFVLSLGMASSAMAEDTGQYIDDAAITAKVKATLLTDSQVKATQVSVETTHGVVQLSGAVDSKSEESEALRAASKVDGVQSVKNLLTVKSTQDD